jgi:hypothetical protein
MNDFTAHIGRLDPASVENLEGRGCDLICNVIETKLVLYSRI